VARGRVVSRGRSGGIHNKEWEAACIDSTALDLTIGTVVAFGLFVADEAETLLRTRGRIRATLNSPSIDGAVTVAVGLAMVSARAVAAGAASLPRPASEGSYPWLWHGWLICDSFSTGAAITDQAITDLLEVDSKAMRKVKEDEQMALVFEVCESIDVGGTLQLQAGFRVLTGD